MWCEEMPMGVLENYDYRGRDHRRFMGWSFCRLYSDINSLCQS